MGALMFVTHLFFFYVASYHRRSHVSVADAFTKIRVAEPYILISNLSLC